LVRSGSFRRSTKDGEVGVVLVGEPYWISDVWARVEMEGKTWTSLPALFAALLLFVYHSHTCVCFMPCMTSAYGAAFICLVSWKAVDRLTLSL
jgi:hypothetical protein